MARGWRWAAPWALALLPALSACASAGGGGGGGGGAAQAAAPPAAAYNGVPGFDTREYPGDAAMTTWRAESPYRWVGYYLPSPCHTGTSWKGKREALREMGWGLAVLFVGEQDWEQAGQGPPTPGATRCTGANLTGARGTADAQEADRQGMEEGFTPGTTIFLDIERVEQVSPALIQYVTEWTLTLLEAGNFTPGLYVHARNATDLYAPVAQELTREAWFVRPKLWVVETEEFAITKAPWESGIGGANIWQGLHDVQETWGGVPLQIDVNVADAESPSGGAP